MRKLTDVRLTRTQAQALAELKRRLCEEFGVEALVLYGSVARGEADDESDLDLLVLTPDPLSRRARHEITDAVFEVNLQYGTNFSTLVLDRDSWHDGPVSVLPIRAEVMKDGVAV